MNEMMFHSVYALVMQDVSRETILEFMQKETLAKDVAVLEEGNA
ncbi:hypothetical protein N9K75_02850 [bacterium]|nr:hypothetical protein [bacterium]